MSGSDANRGSVESTVRTFGIVVLVLVAIGCAVFLSIILTTPSDSAGNITTTTVAGFGEFGDPDDPEPGDANLTLPNVTVLEKFQTMGGQWRCVFANVTTCNLECKSGYWSNSVETSVTFPLPANDSEEFGYCASCLVLVAAGGTRPLYLVSSERTLIPIIDTDGNNTALAYSPSTLTLFWITQNTPTSHKLSQAVLNVENATGDVVAINITELLSSSSRIGALAVDDNLQSLFYTFDETGVYMTLFGGGSEAQLLYSISDKPTWSIKGMTVNEADTTLYWIVIATESYSVLSLNYSYVLEGNREEEAISLAPTVVTTRLRIDTEPTGLFYDSREETLHWILKDRIAISEVLAGKTGVVEIDHPSGLLTNETFYNSLAQCGALFYFSAYGDRAVWQVAKGDSTASALDGASPGDDLAYVLGIALVRSQTYCYVPEVEDGFWSCDAIVQPYQQCTLSCQFPYKLSSSYNRITCSPDGSFLPIEATETECKI